MRFDILSRREAASSNSNLFAWLSINFSKSSIFADKSLGFKNVKQHKYMDSRVLEFKNIDTPGHIRALHSAVVEATK